MKKLLSVLVAISFAVTTLAGCSQPTGTAQEGQTKLEKIKATGKIVMATSPDYAPYEFIDLRKQGANSYVGADIELGRHIADKLKVKLEVQAMDFTATQTAVTMGNVDFGISGFSYTPERAESMLLSDFYNAVNEEAQGVLVLKSAKDTYNSKESFKDKKVAAQNGSLQHNLATSQLTESVIEPITNINDAVMMLKTGKVDAIAVDFANGETLTSIDDELALSDFQFEFESEGLVIAAQKGSDDLMAEINKILREVNESGKYQTWLDDATKLAAELNIE